MEQHQPPKDKRTKAYKIWKALQDQNYGDAISEVTKSMGIKECDGCNERKEKWNYGDKHLVNLIVITAEEFKDLDKFFTSDRQLTMHSKAQAIRFRTLNNKYFPKYGVRGMTCRKCNQRMIARLRRLWESNKT